MKIVFFGAVCPCTFEFAGQLPPGITFEDLGFGGAGTTLGLGGRPTAEGTYKFTVSVRDSLGCTASKEYTLTVRPLRAEDLVVNKVLEAVMPIKVGDTITFVITPRRDGTTGSVDQIYTITDVLPAGLEFVDFDGDTQCSFSLAALTCQSDRPGSFRIRARVKISGRIVNCARVRGTRDLNPENDNGCVTFDVVERAAPARRRAAKRGP